MLDGFGLFDKPVDGGNLRLQARYVYLLLVERQLLLFGFGNFVLFVVLPFLDVLGQVVGIEGLHALFLQHTLQTLANVGKREHQGVGGRGEDFADNHRGQFLLARWHAIYVVAAQEVGHCGVEFLLRVGGVELLRERQTVGVVDILLHVATQGAGVDGLDALAQNIQVLALAILAAETLLAAKQAVVDDTGEAIEFHQRVLEGGGGEQQFLYTI